MINFQGTLLADDRPVFTHKNRGFHLGDVLHEVIKVVNGHLYFWEEHYLRLMASMRILRMEIPMNFTLEFLEEQIRLLIEANGLQEESAFIRISVFRKSGGAPSAEKNEVSYLISGEIGGAPFYILPVGDYEVELFKDFSLNADMLSNLNTSNHLLEVVGSIYASENGYQDCLLINSDKNVVQSLRGNLFLKQGPLIKTPPLSDGAANGIVRKQILEILRKAGTYQVQESSISPFELQKAESLVLTNVRVGIQPITKYRKASYPAEFARELVGKLNAVARLG